MKNFKDDNKKKNMLISWPFIIVLFVSIVVFSFNLVDFVGKMQETIKNKEIVQNRIIEIKNNKIKLENDIDKLQTDSGIEENIRENFGLVKDGEGLVVIVEDKSIIEVEQKESFWTKIKNWFR
ncbi:MAG: septum formation initiator family protein [bacterium]|nr:septum formation initiator family protein [bacterium]